MKLWDYIRTRLGIDRENSYREYQCLNCGADLSLQSGFDSSQPYWVCKGCGQMLINPHISQDIIWFCDGCGQVLNIQPGFTENCGVWECQECGYKNTIDESEVYLSNDEYYLSKNDPYRGLSEEEIFSLADYREEDCLFDREDLILVRHVETGKRYLKKLLKVYDKSIYQFLRDHPILHMPRVIEVFESENALIVIEEYIEGKTLFALLEDRIGTKQAITIAKDVCRILEELHGLPEPIVHRDLKPSNIIVTKDGQTYLLDMNIAKWYSPDKNEDTCYRGTLSFAAPEQVGYGFASSSGKADIYALGIILNLMITGYFPKEKQADGRIGDVIRRCISMEAEQRYTARELREALEKIEEEDGREKNRGTESYS